MSYEMNGGRGKILVVDDESRDGGRWRRGPPDAP
jgi:hypothetical protein